MRIFKTVSNVKQLDFFHNNELIQLFDSTLFLNGELLASNISYYIKVQKELFICFKDKTTKKFNLLDKKLDIFKDIYPFSEPINNEFLLSSDEEFDNIIQKRIRRIDVYSYPLNEKIYTTKNKYHFFQSLWLGKNYIFNTSINQALLTNLEIKTETTLWQYSVAELGADNVSRILGVFGQVLAVVCKMPKNPIPILVGLDITDGSKLFTVQLPLYQMNNNLFFYEANNSIVSIIGEYLWEYSLSTFQVIREKYLPEVFNTEDVHIQVYLATLQGDTIYFAASEFGKSMSSAIVGIFDLKKEQLIDYIDLKPNGKFCMGGNSCPQVSGNKIYVLDTKNTLHILEREDG